MNTENDIRICTTMNQAVDKNTHNQIITNLNIVIIIHTNDCSLI